MKWIANYNHSFNKNKNLTPNQQIIIFYKFNAIKLKINKNA